MDKKYFVYNFLNTYACVEHTQNGCFVLCIVNEKTVVTNINNYKIFNQKKLMFNFLMKYKTHRLLKLVLFEQNISYLIM